MFASTLRLITVTLVFALLGTTSHGQTVSEKDYEEFRKMLTGRWVGEVKWVADWPGLGKKGETAICYLDVDQIEDGNAMVAKFYGGAGSGTVLWVYEAGASLVSRPGLPPVAATAPWPGKMIDTGSPN